MENYKKIKNIKKNNSSKVILVQSEINKEV